MSDDGNPFSALVRLTIAALAFLSIAAPALATETRVVVRAISKDAKFIGTSMGGMQIVLRDKRAGVVLASGVTQGDTGDTRAMMQTPRVRGAVIATQSSAKFVATLELTEPTLIELEAYGPLAQLQSAVTVTSSMWLVPGRHIDGGNAWVVEVPGFVVDILDPPAHVRLSDAAPLVPIRANVMMMCGCPVEAGGLWDASGYVIAARVTRDGKPQGEVPLKYTGRSSQFEGNVPAAKSGTYVVSVYAYDPQNGNTGVDTTTFIVSPNN
jgi:hypothetical protein